MVNIAEGAPSSTASPTMMAVQDNTTDPLTVLLPCAGAGSRFKAPYPKELHCIARGVTALDAALAPVVDLSRNYPVRLVAVVGPGRESTVERLYPYGEHLDLCITFQNERHGPQIMGALRAAHDLVSERVLIVLPDQYFSWEPGANPLLDCVRALQADEFSVIAAKPGSRPLTEDGALAVQAGPHGPRVTAAAEKPQDPTGFDAAWVVVGLRRSAWDRLPDVFRRTAGSPLVGAPVVFAGGYRHLHVPSSANENSSS
ncbi:hypothetical protein [Micromonospora sp. C95]|uniref:hypothetical protein n=1 Tax=Micromonospora sp. C95 TaxID=2824882 RepID=UPI001B391B6D|nr:hypothetical protein [Micromonospora sp. C95]MBQ1026068.1 hypothetical protein [Micromonospora sp. C95]